MFHAINGRECRVVSTRSERDMILREHGGFARSFFMRSNAEFYAKHGMTEQEKEKLETTEAHGVAYTYGARSKSNKGIFASAGVWFGQDSKDNISKKVCDGVSPTNQRAELSAILEAVIVAEKRDYRVLLTHTNSKYCMNLLKDVQLHSYKRFLDKRGVEMVNGDILKKIHDIMTSENIFLILRYVYGNSGNEGSNPVVKIVKVDQDDIRLDKNSKVMPDLEGLLEAKKLAWKAVNIIVASEDSCRSGKKSNNGKRARSKSNHDNQQASRKKSKKKSSKSLKKKKFKKM